MSKEVIDKYNLRYEQDELITSHLEGHPRWKANLSNGLTVYQDDFRQYDMPETLAFSTWSRLRHYCYSELVNIDKLFIQFRTNIQEIKANGRGFYFCKSVFGGFGMDKSLDFFVTGTPNEYLTNVNLQRWQLPELIVTEEEDRELDKSDVRLILNKEFR